MKKVNVTEVIEAERTGRMDREIAKMSCKLFKVRK